MQSISSRIWSRVAVSISCNDNNYTMGRKGYGAFSFLLHPCMHAVMKLSNDGDEFFRAAIFCHDFPNAVTAEHVRCFGQINISRVEVSILFLTLLLQLSCSKHHVNSPMFLMEATLTLHLESMFKMAVDAYQFPFCL